MTNDLYIIEQGAMTKSGCGDLNIYRKYTTIDEALKDFNEIKNDLTGWNIPPHGYLLTILYKENDPENIIEYYEAK